ncbi:hypothetical protein ORV05_21370 [Amycolatopsis cynarae]|uniref:Acetate CoA-transferase n=1 Tax=Amycolatopsis cynarae TaxID=2995223 RepID=A0ABY7BBM7_9PSEU|nr:CoA-transferase [Amycolatopsis sp. HUAS 11-8]WAL69761.1 hypothetical protein ORV05_21370 [Amycolatopsis sp. HUAS 11-8]
MCRDHLRDGMTVHVASTMSRPNALLRVAARTLAGRASFTVSSNAFHANLHAWTMAGLVRHAITGFAGDTYPSSRPNPLYSRLPQGDPFTVEEWSLLTLLQRLIAGAGGNPVAVTTSLVGTDLEALHEKHGRSRRLTGAGRGAVVIPALCPDVTLLHATFADRQGNLYLNGPVGEGWWGAMAARVGVVATVEMVVDTPPRGGVSIPADRVLALAPCPYGAHPQGLPPWPEGRFEGYLDDYDFLVDLARACATPEGREDWYRRWVTEVPGQDAMMRRLGGDRLARLRDGRFPASHPAGGEPTWRERHVLLAARAIVDRVLERGYRAILAGIGTSHLAAWLAAAQLRERGCPVQLHAELGLVDLQAAPGDVFLFSQRHAARCRDHAGTLEVLGALASGGRGRALAVLSAGEIDAGGRINSSRTADGAFLVGSGGANDFASHLDTLVVAAASPRRFVPRVAFATCPGHNVHTVATQYGRLARGGADEPFVLRSWLPPAGDPAADPITTLRERTRWPVLDTPVEPEKPFSDKEIGTLREFDPEGVYR